MKVVGVGPLTASAVVATVSDLKQFKNGAQFGAWIGLTLRQHSSGGKNKLGRITERGDTYLRTLLIQGAKTAVLSAHKLDDPISQWVCRLRALSGWQVAAVALANKSARILWAVLAEGTAYDARHVRVIPAGELPIGVRTVLSDAVHDTQNYANRRTGYSLQPTQRRELHVRRFKSVEQAQRFLSLHARVRNPFCNSRQMLKADNHRLLRESTASIWAFVTRV